MKSILIAILFAPTFAFAAYDCRLAVFAKDLPDGHLEYKYTTRTEKGAHGGNSYDFQSGAYRLSAVSDERWLGITWIKNGVLIATAITARGEDNPSAQALLIYNPEEPSELASLDCSLQK